MKDKKNSPKCPNLRFPEFEGEWEACTLDDLVYVVGGGTPDTNNPKFWNGDIQWFTPSEIGKSKYVLASKRTISEAGLKSSNAKLLPINTILLSTRATIGECSIAKVECCTNQGFQSLIVKDADLDFVYYLTSTRVRNLIKRSSGSTFLEISKKEVEKTACFIPQNKQEQAQIGRLLSIIDQRIGTQIKIIEELESLKKGLLKKMLSINKQPMPELRFPQHNEIWIKKKIKDIAKVITGSTPPTNQRENYGRNFLWATPPDLSGKKYITTTYKMLSVKGSTLTRHIPEDSILMSCIGIIGKLGISTEKMCTNQQINSLILHQFIDVNFAYYVMANNAKRYSMYAATQVVPILSKSLLEEQILYVPSYEEQVKIGTLLSLIDKKIELEQSTLESQKKQKYYLLQNLFI